MEIKRIENIIKEHLGALACKIPTGFAAREIHEAHEKEIDDAYLRGCNYERSRLKCYSCGEKIKWDKDKPECYCNDCLPMDGSVIKRSEIQPVLDVYEKYEKPKVEKNESIWYIQCPREKDMWQAIKTVAERLPTKEG